MSSKNVYNTVCLYIVTVSYLHYTQIASSKLPRYIGSLSNSVAV